MGKKKHKHGHRGDDHRDAGGFPFAGLFAAAAAQAGSPAGRHAIAGALRRAADAIDRPGATPPRPPEPPLHDLPPEPPRPPRPDVSPEVAKVIGSVAAGLERWASKAGRREG